VKHIDRHTIVHDFAARMRFLEEFVGFAHADWEALGESAAVLSPRLPELLDAIYDQLLAFDDTRRLFTGPEDTIDPRYLAIRKEHLSEWLLALAGGGDRRRLATYLSMVAARHTGASGDPERVVPPRYIVALTSFIQSEIWQAVFDALPGQASRVRRLGLAWNKILMIQLELFLKVLVPHFPAWDESEPAAGA
jgi:Protoglobin